MQTKKQPKITELLLVAFISILVIAIALNNAVADPDGVNVISNTTSGKAASSPSNRTDGKGTINRVILDVLNQDYRWKAYYGNVTGTFVLADSDNYRIYSWPSVVNRTGEVYFSRNSSVAWGTISCANTTGIGIEESELGINSANFDSITRTFNATAHQSFLVGTINISNSTCPVVYPYVNSTAQAGNNTNNKFQEVLLQTNQSQLVVYTGLLGQQQTIYKNGSVADFELIVPDNGNVANFAPVSYYIFVELD